MKRVLRTFAAGARVYAVGGELPDNHPVVKASPGLFESVAAPAKSSRKGKGKGKPAEEKPAEDGDGQEQKDETDADGDT